MTVVITGATGQVGHAIARRLAADSNGDLRAVMRSPKRAEALPAGVTAVTGDVTDPASLRAAFEGATTVYHAAGIPEQWRQDESEFTRINVEGTRNVVEAAVAAGVERFVYTSTADVMHQDPDRPLDDPVMHPNPGPSVYQRSKWEADRIVTEALDRGLPAVFLHPAGMYGPAPFLVLGLNDVLIRLAQRKVPALLPGGIAVIYSDDVADAHVRAARGAPVGARYVVAESYQPFPELARAVAAVEPKAKVPRVMPLGLARAVSAAGERIGRMTGKPPLIPRGALELFAQEIRLSGERLQRDLGWQPTPFQTGVERSLASFREKGWL